MEMTGCVDQFQNQGFFARKSYSKQPDRLAGFGNDEISNASVNNDALVRFVDVEKSYDGDTLVVKELNLDVYSGEFLTILGPSGSGKTTCLMMLAGFETVTEGTILLDGKPINHLPPYRRNIGMVFQNYALFPHMTVAENLAFPLKVRRFNRAEIEDRVEKALDMVRLSGLGHRIPLQLSGGQQQRIAVARALVFEPKLVLMDEPLGALDKQLREQMQYEIKRLHAELGLTVVYVTHDQSEALVMSDRIAVFHEGAIQQLSTPIDIYERPQTAFVAQFIGENNQFYGTTIEIGNKSCSVKLSDDTIVYALPVGVQDIGMNVALSIRPERILIGNNIDSCQNKIKAVIKELHYLGDHLRVYVGLPNSVEIAIKISNAMLQGVPKPGDEIWIGWKTEDCRAMASPSQ